MPQLSLLAVHGRDGISRTEGGTFTVSEGSRVGRFLQLLDTRFPGLFVPSAQLEAESMSFIFTLMENPAALGLVAQEFQEVEESFPSGIQLQGLD